MLENLTPADEQAEIGVLGVFDACGGSLVTTKLFLDFQEPVSIDPSFVGATRQALKATSDGVLKHPERADWPRDPRPRLHSGGGSAEAFLANPSGSRMMPLKMTPSRQQR